MNRSGYDYDGDYDQWATIRWRGQLASAIRGKRGQAFLRDLLDALDGMPNKRLIANDLIRDGEVCAIGSLGVKRGVDLSALDPEDFGKIAETFGVAHQIVQEVEWMNDEGTWAATPEWRWQQVRDWVSKLVKVDAGVQTASA